MNISSYWVPFRALLVMDLYLLKKTIKDKLINLCIWVASSAFVATYILPFFGMSANYGLFLLVGLCASAGLFEVFPSAAKLVDDIKGDQVILYHMTLPLPSALVILRLMIMNALSAVILGLAVLPLGKLLLWNHFNMANLNVIKFLIIFILASAFYGSYTIFIATRVPDMTKIGNVWMRFVYPLWFLGGYQFSWQSLRKIVPLLAYLNLANPIVYIMEGVRASILGQEGFLNFWLCCCMVILFCFFSIWLGIRLMKQRLDVL